MYQIGAILLFAVIVAVFASSSYTTNLATGDGTYWDNLALNNEFCEISYTNGVMYNGYIYRNHCYIDPVDLREKLKKYYCQAGQISYQPVDCAAKGKVCEKDACRLPKKYLKSSIKTGGPSLS